jgi:hypothetical protein
MVQARLGDFEFALRGIRTIMGRSFFWKRLVSYASNDECTEVCYGALVCICWSRR